MDRCYDCGVELKRENRTKEHIPARNLFTGYSDEYKKNRITVPACNDCNSKYSKIDQELRDAIGIMNDHDKKQAELTGKAVRSILRRSDWEERFNHVSGSLPGVTFQADEFNQLHIKNFKGLFYHTFGTPFPKDFEIGVVSEADQFNDEAMRLAQFFYNYVMTGGGWRSSGHEDVFRYKLKTCAIMNDGQVGESIELIEAIGIAAVMVYHNKLSPVIFAMKTEFINQVIKEKQP